MTEQEVFNSEQEVFNKVWDHIITQGKPSADKYGHCYYRGPDGLKCAAGIFLTDEQAIELDKVNMGWDEACDVFYPELSDLPANLIRALQACHDASSELNPEGFIKSFKRNATLLADSHDLTVTEGL